MLLPLWQKLKRNWRAPWWKWDITLPTKVCIVKAMFFPIVMYGCELDSKKGWVLKNWYLWTVVLEKTLETPLDSKEIKPVNPKRNQPWIFIGRTEVEAEAPILRPPDPKSWLFGKDSDAGKDWRQEKKGMTEDEMIGWHHRFNGHEFEQAPRDAKGKKAWRASFYGIAKSWTWLSDWKAK